MTRDHPALDKSAKTSSSARWSYGDHDASGTDWDAVDDAISTLEEQNVEGLGSLLNEAKRAASEATENAFECGTCGLVHKHGTGKKGHHLREEGVTQAFIDKMKYEANCHCGLHELARLLNHWSHLNTQVFEDQDNMSRSEIDSKISELQSVCANDNAPIPPEVETELDSDLGSL